MFSKEQEEPNYQLLQDNSSQNDLDKQQKIRDSSQERKCQNRLQYSIWQLVASIFIIGFAIILTLHLQLIHKVYPPPLHCGSSVEEAVSRGCKWDLLSKYWLPAECSRVGSEEYVNNEWNYYTTKEGGETLNDISGRVGSDNDAWWSTEKEHSTHCAYLLVRMGHVLATSSRADNALRNFKHTKHCAMFLLDRALMSPTVNNITTRGRSITKLGSC
ncbi:hypothetical protein G7Y89_g13901 [Cudoniella acicularis]|uniref:Uncharacterized protein n=1 Tax=Cudoniella acicularis TaxID=354080 RepID=A0A8H4R7N6_9HELO|nr:hypothetical protein G7Y89_g13901 [Cudoniella acicularis]